MEKALNNPPGTVAGDTPAIDSTTIEPATESIPDLDRVPDGGYGWICVISITTINGFTWGVIASYGVFLGYYLSNDVFPGATPLDFAFIGGLNFGVSMLVTSLVTVATRLFGTHAPMCVGILLMTGGFIAASFATRIWELYLAQGITIGVGVGFIFIPSVQVIPQWFDKRRSFANSICSAGSGIGGIIFSFAIQAIIRNISLGWALRITGIVSGAMNAIATAFIRNRNASIKPRIRGFDANLLKNQSVLLLFGWAVFSMLGYMVLLYSLPDFSRTIGLSASQAAATSAFLNLGTAIGRPCIGLLSDRFGRFTVAGLATFMNAITVFAIWLPANSYGVTILFAIIVGAILGVFWMVILTTGFRFKASAY